MKKTNQRKHLLRPMMAGLAALWVMTPVWADDTEIFFGNFSGGDFLPNVLFIMDTSGSMRSAPESGGRDAKIDIVKDALKQLANEISGVNVGLMRFSNPGGPVIYPVTYIDKQISSFGTGEKTVVASVGGSNADATEIVDTGVVDLVRTSSSVGSGAETQTSVFRLGGRDEDAEEQNDGDFSYRSDNLDLAGVGDYVGVRFQNTDMPRNALITDSRLTMMLTNDSGDNRYSLTTLVAGDPVPAADFDSGSNDRPSDRSLTSANILWTMDDPVGSAPSPGSTITSPNLASIIQELVNNSNWQDGGSNNDDVVLILRQTNASASNARRELRAYEDRSDASELTVTYVSGGGSGGTQNYASGLWFESLAVPQNATITSASLELVPTNTVSGSHTLTVGIEAGSTVTTFTGSNGEISSRLAGATSGVFPVTSWIADSAVQLDVTSLVQSEVNDANWCGGEPMAFLVGNSGNRLDFGAWDGDSSLAPVLRVTYDADSITAGNTCIQTAQSMRVGNSRDDVESYNSSGSSFSSSRDYISVESDDWAALRFDGYTLPSDATISSAYLYLTAYGDQNSDSAIKLSVEAVADSTSLTSGDGLRNRSWTGNVNWSITNNWNDRDEYQSPDISALINAALANGFSSGNALTLRIDHNSGATRTLSTYDRNPVYAARLEVSFESAGDESFNTARTEFITAVDSLSAEGFTPIQDTLFEGYQYYAGNPAIWGRYRGGHNENGVRINVANESADAEPFYYTRVSVQGSIEPETYQVVRPAGCTLENLSSTACDDPNGSGEPEGEYLAGNPIYKSPISNECQFESHIVFLTDGAANEPHSENLIENVIGSSSCPSSSNSSQKCVVELAEHMYTTDLSAQFSGDQRVVTHMVGFDYDEPWLERIAGAGGGTYATASDLDTLVAEFKAIIAEVLKTDTSFVAPVAAINQFNRLTNLDDVYFAVFKPDGVPAWAGNLKRYRLGTFNGVSNVLIDANGVPALDPDSGFFKSTAQSYWSSSADGADVTAGGAGEQVPAYSLRNVYTDLLSAPTTLSDASNSISVGNANLTDSILGVGTGRDTLISWIRGQDTEDEDGDTLTSESRLAIGDPLHSRPVAVTYGVDGTGAPDVTLFFGTNAGNLHAINATTGGEQFTYIPRELLGLQQSLRANEGSINHYYGLDGSPAVWTKNSGTPAISSAEGDHVYLYIGQRRGGRNYYALDVTNRAAPKLKWKINGGSGDFTDLGQTWARPIPGKLNIDGVATDVLYITGGYDEANDDETTRSGTADSIGNAIYIVDANTGQRLWSVGSRSGHTLTKSEMTHAIPASAAVYDVNSDGYDDGLFVGDVGGQVWRFDFVQGQPIASLATGGVIAKLGLGGETSAANNRRFYHSPDVALTDLGGSKKLVVTIGSGSRPSPLSEVVNDRFYALFQDAVFGAPVSYVPLLEGDDPSTGATETSDLYDATANLLQTGSSNEILIEQSKLSLAQGWYIDLTRSGEKVLSTPLSFRGTVSFTTYEPTNISGSCIAKAGTSRVYLMALADATATEVWGEVNGTEVPQRSYALDTPSIVEEPVIICTGEGCELFVGPEQPPVELLDGGQIVRTYWRQDQ